MDQGREGLPYRASMVFVHWEYLSSESSNKPSISKRQALTGGNAVLGRAMIVDLFGLIVPEAWGCGEVMKVVFEKTLPKRQDSARRFNVYFVASTSV